MSRSYRKSPCGGNCGASEKWFKQKSNRKVRRNVKVAVQKLIDDVENAENLVLPVRSRDLTDTWDGPKDGKSWWGNYDFLPSWYKKLMRK